MALTKEQMAQVEQHEAEIRGLINLLEQTDYVAYKIAEGAATSEEYADVLALRSEWRQKINDVQAEMAELLGVEAEMLAGTYSILNAMVDENTTATNE